VAKVRQVATAIPQLSVVGIAGPGDPLANIGRSFKTLELIREQLPDLKLCLSTNGLMLPDAVDRLLDVGVDHVTVTINTLDPDIAAKSMPGCGLTANGTVVAKPDRSLWPASSKGCAD
jgi:nitrogen fixation protein NifB